MQPAHGSFQPQPGNGGFLVEVEGLTLNGNTSFSYTAGQSATVRVVAPSGNGFRGFLVIAHVPGQTGSDLTLLGTFTPGNANTQATVPCDPAGVNNAAAIGHSQRLPDVSSVEMMWMAPMDAGGTVDFRYTVVVQFSTFYVRQSAAQNALVNQQVTTPPPVPTIPMRDPEDYRLTFRQPPFCQLPECDVFVGIDTNTGDPSLLDITMQGIAQGWLAVGFSSTPDMFDADVVGCIRDPLNDTVDAIDTWNSLSPTRNNIADVTGAQDILLHNSSFINGTISCTFSRSIQGSDPPPIDRPLDDQYYVIYGYRAAEVPNGTNITSFPIHGVGAALPTSTHIQFNPSTDSNTIVIPVRAPEDYRLTFRQPPFCELSECDVFVGIDSNAGDPTLLDITMQGMAQGWLAVGFSSTADMFDADVVGCIRDPLNDNVNAIDTWNSLSPTRNNIADDTGAQDILLYNSSFINGTISCTFSRPIWGSDPPPVDRPLNETYYVIYGYRAAEVLNNTNITSFPVHDVGAALPTSSGAQFNVSADTNTFVSPVRAVEQYRLSVRQPQNCQPSQCDVFVGIDTNAGDPSLLDITMQGMAQGWVAVGFSSTRNMFDADVVGCIRDPMNDTIVAIDTWNSVVEPRNNIADLTGARDVTLIDSNFVDGRISCTFTRSIIGSERAPNDQRLDDNYFILYGTRSDPVASGANLTSFPIHTAIPMASEVMLNPSVANNQPIRNPQDYRLILRDRDCIASECNIYVGIDTNANSDLLDIYLEGDATGWVAVGFSDTQDMFSADVVGCNINSNTGAVEVLDTWNSPSPGRVNNPDNSMGQDVLLIQSSINNGRISCTFTRRIAGSDPVNQDLNLDSSYFIMYGVGPDGSASNFFLPHQFGPGLNPLLSSRFNPARDSANFFPGAFPRVQLLRAHGIIMLIAWPLLAVSGIFFAAWMRPALPNGEWFQMHRAFLLGSLFVGAVGFVLAFIANARNTPTAGLITFNGNPVGTAHYVIGIVVMLLHIINPLIAVCRCKPSHKNRWIFNIVHGTAVGLFVEVLALINIGLGLARFGPVSIFGDLTILWVYIGYLAFYLALIGALFIVFTLLSCTSQDSDRSKTAPALIKPLVGSPEKGRKQVPTSEGIELAVPGGKPPLQDDDDQASKPKLPSRDSPLRWGALGVFLLVNVIMMVILIILIAVGQT